MTPDCELLAAFADNQSEDAFAELVRRHVNLVYSAALRQVGGDAHLAQDIAQNVFSALARKAGSLRRHTSLTGWLYTSTHFAARDLVRADSRRRNREEQFMRDPTLEPAPNAEWNGLRSSLDEVMHGLKDSDREAILLRYFENLSFPEVGAKLGLNENAARMRVERALEKLRAAFSKRGVATTAGLAAAISTHAVQTAPAGLAAAITGGSLAVAAAGGGTINVLSYVLMTKIKLGAMGAALVAVLAVPLVVEHQANVKSRAQDSALQRQTAELDRLKAENDRLAQTVAELRNQQRAALRVPPPAMAKTASRSDGLQVTNLMVRLLKGETPKLTASQIDAYLKQNRRDAGSLLTAFRATGDRSLLREALENFPNDPRVNFAAVFDADASPEELRQRLDGFKQSAPDNALANYLSALNYFKSGQTGEAVQELNAAAGKGAFQDYSWDFVQNAEEAWRSAGYTEAETKMVATWQLVLPQLQQLSDLDHQIVDMARSYGQSGDQASEQAALQIDVNLGQRMAVPATDPLINQLVGLAIERDALNAMDPNASYGSSGQTVKDTLDQLTQQSASIKDLVKQMEPLQESMTPQDWINYNERTKTFGEENALQWLLNKYGQK